MELSTSERDSMQDSTGSTSHLLHVQTEMLFFTNEISDCESEVHITCMNLQQLEQRKEGMLGITAFSHIPQRLTILYGIKTRLIE